MLVWENSLSLTSLNVTRVGHIYNRDNIDALPSGPYLCCARLNFVPRPHGLAHDTIFLGHLNLFL